MSILHILNGDSTLYSFKQTDIDGDTMVWREVLSQGPLSTKITSADFWRTRAEFIRDVFKADTYQQDMIDQLAMLSEAYDEVNLWFEFDLHCQVNMLGVMNYFNQLSSLSSPAICLICPAEYPNKPDFRGMGELNGEELEYLYDNIRVQLSEADFVIAAEAWELYVNGNAADLQRYLNTNTFWGSLHCLKDALAAQLKRLQTNALGLNYIEQQLLHIYNSGITDRGELYRTFWNTEKIYGFGDTELDIYMEGLRGKGHLKPMSS
ncbi:DUF1835 domain-containing protein [Mucilaginibacter myungsuensis]|uniref:DUF1835 domain-containing protein n=1 Tax=Mucilaginibacter myungsuensis TaxID=649104 RepID=A0A929L193_9SPHI|nr:DUF1835 domain-containing protein [Mucilaginibacter myungsuensis]MBE9664288.1 DUF1835 domain-containing protein [Mucilaginibacter myungsuensis]MDN3599992.1 DUF1835 domain-containing protein [Mucilaginibacter myungsuensis]